MTSATTAVTRLILSNFRNYASLRLETDARMVVLTGPNGAGKTNILEALSLLSPGRGLRRASFDKLVRQGTSGGWAVSARVKGEDHERAVGTGLRMADGAGRRVRIDGQTATRSDKLLDVLRVLWLTPAMDGLFTASGSERRRFLDRLTLAIDPGHGRRVTAFERIMRTRNRVLAQRGDAALLDALERQLAETGLSVSVARAETAHHLAARLAADAQAGSPFPQSEIRLEGDFETAIAGLAAVDAEDRYRAALHSGRSRDRAAGRTLDGPHRSDLVAIHQAKAIPAALASTGEQKALLIGLVLAHAGLIATLSAQTPILLLDEVAAHLDLDRRAALFDRLEALSVQAWMTGTDTALFEALGTRAQALEVTDGQVRPG